MPTPALAAASVLCLLSLAEEAAAPVRLGAGSHVYEWVHDFCVDPGDKSYGPTHGGIAVDRRGHVFFSNDSERAIIELDENGAFVKAFAQEYANGIHCMIISEEDGKDVITFAHHARGEVVRMTTDGEVRWTIGWPEQSGLYSSKSDFHPTAVAVARNGDVYVADGYGKSYIHRYDKDQKLLRSFGGVGTEAGKMKCCHGIIVDERSEPPTLLVADRENHRLQVFDLEGNQQRVVTPDVRRPSAFDVRGEDLAIADLEGRVTILDRDYQVVAHLGDNSDPSKRANFGVEPKDWKDGEFTAPHAVRWDAEGNLYVLDWNVSGRLSKLQRVR